MKKMRLKIEKWAHGGYTLVHFEGKPIFVSGGIPGEEVDITLSKEEKKISFGIVSDVITPSPLRISSDCSLFGDCGGCSYRHLPYSEELKIKTKLLHELFPFYNREIQIISGSSHKYRNNVQWQTDGTSIGFFARDSHILLEVESCPNLPFELQPKNVLKKDIQKLQTERIQENRKNPRKLEFRLGKDGKAILSNEPSSVLVFGREYKIPEYGFFQINSHLIEPWLTEIKLMLGDAKSILELFCGVGVIGLALDQKFDLYSGYEINKTSILCAESNKNKTSQNHYRFTAKDLYKDPLPKKDLKLTTWIVNPPRSGLNELILKQMEENKPKLVLYSSCNAHTLQRDSKTILKMGFVLEELKLVDFFPRTQHYEVLAKFSR
ncbi:methyltransferase [Leptospira sp. 96542]|nr:methyltransferase [Leptospira sp. 96542]